MTPLSSDLYGVKNYVHSTGIISFKYEVFSGTVSVIPQIKHVLRPIPLVPSLLNGHRVVTDEKFSSI